MKPEPQVLNETRLAAARRDMTLFRNNSGALCNQFGRLVRYGLGHESKALNAEYKSSDLIGITTRVVTEEDVGKTVGLFTSLEIKPEGWVYGKEPREVAQKRWLDMVKRLGGIGEFVSDAQQIERLKL
jgi:hypothetical protein